MGLVALGALLLSAAACHQEPGAVLLLVVTAAGSPPAVKSLNVTINGPAGTSSEPYAPGGAQSISFPTSPRLPKPAA
jgi:hypothetical protein